jgi:hypothetical protein
LRGCILRQLHTKLIEQKRVNIGLLVHAIQRSLPMPMLEMMKGLRKTTIRARVA